MLELRATKRYKKSYSLMKKRGYDMSLLNEVINKLQMGIELDAKYKNHKLNGKYKDFFECHIQNDWLLVYKIYKNELILELCYLGTHSDLF